VIFLDDSIVIEDLTKYYGKFLALKDLSLRVPTKENIGLLGPNGAGKSTTLKILCGLIRPNSGKAYINGIDVTAQPEKALVNIGAIIETPEFYSFLTPEDCLSYFGRLRGMKGDYLKKRIKEVIELVKLERWAKVKIEKFSRGMKQRLGLAQSLLHDPPILILDEPSLGLDPRGVVEFREIIKGAGQEKTVFFASHQLVEVSQICNRVAVIVDGQLLAFDTITEMEKKYQTLEQAYLKLTGGSVEQ
jgi:ABC-2 type transport system ATP-binding protein